MFDSHFFLFRLDTPHSPCGIGEYVQLILFLLMMILCNCSADRKREREKKKYINQLKYIYKFTDLHQYQPIYMDTKCALSLSTICYRSSWHLSFIALFHLVMLFGWTAHTHNTQREKKTIQLSIGFLYLSNKKKSTRHYF